MVSNGAADPRTIRRVRFGRESGFASVVANGATQPSIEVGLIAREGMSGLVVVLGADRPAHETTDRQDCDGRRMCWDQFGYKSACGWFIGYSIPLDFGGLDHTINLRARHWMGD